MPESKLKRIGILILQLCLLSLALFVIEKLVFLFVKRTDFSDRMVSMGTMLFLTVLFLFWSKKKNIALSIFPDKFNIFYIIFTVVAAVLFFLSPSFTGGNVEAILVLIYSAIVIPVFEETIFRGYVWNKLNKIFTSEWKTYVVSTLLFALWHLGYISSIAFRVQSGLAQIMFWKVITGLCFGIVLGLVRWKAKNCYITILLHGIMNIFSR